MTTIRILMKKATSLLLDTSLATIGQNFIKFVVTPSLIILLVVFSFKTYQQYKDFSYCDAQGISQSQCAYFIEYGD